MRTAFPMILAGVLAGAGAACGVTSPSDLKAEPPFTSTVPPGGQSETMFFSTSKTGEFIVKVTALSPDSGAVLTAQYGTPGTFNGVFGCSIIGAAGAGLNKTVFDQTLAKSDYCLQLSDPGGALPRTQTFTIVVSHS